MSSARYRPNQQLEIYTLSLHDALPISIKFHKQCLHYGVLAFSRAGLRFPAARGSRTRKIIKKPSVFKLFQKKWCWRSSFEVHLFIF